METLGLLISLIISLAFQIRPYVGCLVQYLPLLWKQSEEHNMLRCAILTTLVHLVQVGAVLECPLKKTTIMSLINSIKGDQYKQDRMNTHLVHHLRLKNSSSKYKTSFF